MVEFTARKMVMLAGVTFLSWEGLRLGLFLLNTPLDIAVVGGALVLLMLPLLVVWSVARIFRRSKE